MATLQKFKLFATQCAAAANIPTQSPTTSPLLLRHRRRPRRKTLRMLLTRRPQVSHSDHHQANNNQQSPPPSTTAASSTIHGRRLKLKELFFTSPTSHCHSHEEASSGIGPARSDRVIGPIKVVRPADQPFGFGCRRNRMLLRKAWRPVLGTIDEIQD